MQAIFRRHLWLSQGERSLVTAYLTVSLFGAVLAFHAVRILGPDAATFAPLGTYQIWICVSGAFGAGAGMYLARHHLGQAGIMGWVRAVGGFVMLCFAASLIAGTLALPGYGTMFGPFTLGVILAGSPMLAALWICTLCGAHLLVANWQTERDSIFVQGRAPGP